MSNLQQNTGTAKSAPENEATPEVRTVIEREVIGGIPTLGLPPDGGDENGETREGRAARRRAEDELLACEIPDSLGAKVRQLLGQGLWVDPDAPDSDNARTMSGSLDRAMSRVAAIQLRAIAIALAEVPSGESDLDGEIALSKGDAALALASIATTLEVGFSLADDLRLAQDNLRRRPQAKAVAS